MPAPLASVALFQRFGYCSELTEVQFLGFKQRFGSPDSKNRKLKSEEKAGDLGHLS